MTQYSPNVHGRGSQRTATLEALREEWGQVKALEKQLGGTWVPRRSVYIREGVQPRGLNRETVMRYAEEYDALPPITVQRDTFVLIGGRHRLEAAQAAGRVVVKVVELDISDDGLVEAAWRDNLTHGQPYTLEERRAYLRLLLANPANSALSNRDLAERTGMDRDAISRFRASIGEPSPHKSNNPAGTTKTIVTGGLPPNREKNHKPQPVVRSYDPGPDEEYDEDGPVAAQDEPETAEEPVLVVTGSRAVGPMTSAGVRVDKETGEMSSSETFAYLQDDAGVKISVDWFGRASAKRKRAMEAGLDQAIEWLTNVREAL